MQAEVKNEFLRFIATKTDEAVFSPEEGYFPFSVIADAFEKGAEVGEQSFKQKVRDMYVANIEIAIEGINTLLSYMSEKGYEPNRLYLNHTIHQTVALIAVNDELNTNKDFISYAYSKACDLQKSIALDKKVTVTINFIDSSDINEELLESDGYSFKYDFKHKANA